MSFLLIERGNKVGQRIALDSFPVTLGRDAQNGVMVEDEEVSRFHIRIKKRGNLYIIEDLESRNGTFVNGDRVVNSTLHSGDKILIGSTEYQFFASEPNIQIKTEIMALKAEIFENLGINGPIGVDVPSNDKAKPPFTRVDPEQLAKSCNRNPENVKRIYEVYSNLIVVNDLQEASHVLLKSLGKLMPGASRGIFFIWSSQSKQLIPLAHRTYTAEKPFLLNKKCLDDAVRRHQAIWLGSALAKKSGRATAILPMMHNQELIGIVHLESDKTEQESLKNNLDIGQTLVARSSPIFETMILRKELDVSVIGMIETIIATIEAKDTYTRGHSERVSQYSMAIADELKLNQEVKRLLMMSALCHDIGKIGVPDAILKKASMLSIEEYEEMKLHPVLGADIINNMPNAHRFLSGIKYHHEKWDGTGYPDGLAGEEIPFFARIIAIADAFDALVSGRAYSGFMTEQQAIDKMVSEKELFDPEVLKAFVKAHDNGRLSLKTSTQSGVATPPTDEKESRRKSLSNTKSAAKKPSKIPS
jgi:HD-GYP domain-containing protein (c-di-GMP phosphodiesterase class II)/pSer/pThr/pTyr-binding forkhead associated (FHA) protein